MNVDNEIINLLDDNEIIEISDDDGDVTQVGVLDIKVQFKNLQNPVSLQRHRFTKKGGRVYNPSSSAQSKFRTAVKSKFTHATFPLYPKNVPLFLTIIFRMKRPKKHFVNNSVSGGVLKVSAPKVFFIGKPDVDNMAKFVLDSLNGVLYEDDSQVVTLNATKVYDNEESYLGSTEVFVDKMNEEKMSDMLVGQH